MGTRLNYGGLVVAGIGFFLTRFTVTLAIYENPVRFYLAGIVPLALGLGLAAFGVALTVADVDRTLVRTTALWCVTGAVTMLVLVVLTLLGSTTGGLPDVPTLRSRTYLSNFLIGGSVGGTLTGLYASRNRRQQDELRRQTNRLSVLNRLLRHEIINAVAVIRGYATSAVSGDADAAGIIEDRADAIERTIEEVKYLTRREGRAGTAGTPIDLGECLAASVDTIAERYPDAAVSLGSVPDDVRVSANERLEQVFTHLLENAVVHGGDQAPSIGVAATPQDVRVTVSDDGPGLPAGQRQLLETGDIEEFDDPDTGFGLNVVRLLVESYGGRIETDAGPGGTSVTVVLPRARPDGSATRPSPADLADVRPAIPHLIVTLGAAAIAGVFYGIASEMLGGNVAGIGVFYGAADPVVGWITHEFHSVVFGFVYVGLVSLAPTRYLDAMAAYVAIGIGWAVTLWLVAAGVIAPIWLRLLGIPADIPSLSVQLLVSHLAWGVSLGILVALGYRYVTPRLARLIEGFRGRSTAG